MSRKFYRFLLVLAVISFPISADAGIGTDQEELKQKLGGAIYRDLTLSTNENMACQTCHHPAAGFADPMNRIFPEWFPVSRGSIPTLYGGRNAPISAYAGFNPIFHYDDNNSVFVGGLFWDGRATGRQDYTATGGLGAGPTGDPLADQAKGPFGNPVEMGLTPTNTGMTTEAAVVGIIERSGYSRLFKTVFGQDAFADVGAAYNNASIAIAAFERSCALNKFNSKFDKFIREQGGDVSSFGVVTTQDGFRKYVGPPKKFRSRYFSFDQADGLAIFNADSYTQANLPRETENGGQCYRCHLTQNHLVAARDPNRPKDGPAPGTYNPLLTDFTFDNLGIPVNPQIANLAGPQNIDYGLGAQTVQLQSACPGCNTSLQRGKFKVPCLRNLSRTPPYGHNGYFATIYDIVHFYNTRDTGSWPLPEVSENLNKVEMGNLGLTLKQELNLVKFLKTLDD